MLAVSIYVLSKYGNVWDWSVNEKETFKSVIIVLALLGIPAGFAFHKKRISRLPAGLLLDKKLKEYRVSFFVKIVTIEALSIIALTGYLFSADVVFLIIFGLLFVVYLLNIPTKMRVFSGLQTDDENKPR